MATNAKNLAEYLNNETTSATADIADGSITTAKLANNAVTSAKALNLGRRNMIINGAMQVAQRATSATSIATSGYYTVDRVDIAMSTTSGQFTQSQVTDAPDGFSHALKFDCTTADTSVAAGETTIVMWQLEGQDVQQMAKGSSGAKQVTVSFYAKANAAATYICELKDFTNTRTVSKAFTVGTSYTRHEITFPADTTGAITSNNAKGLSMNIWLHAGSTYSSGTLQTTWGAQTNANRAVGISNFYSSTANTFFITGVQMELGATATEFEHRSFAEELSLCRRYYQKLLGNQYYGGFHAYTGSSGHFVQLVPSMRAAPTVTNYNVRNGTSGAAASNQSATYINVDGFNCGVDGAGGADTNFSHINQAFIEATAEL